MKKYVFYPGCIMPTEQYAYEMSIRETLPIVEIELVDVEGFSCCGEPMKSVNQLMTLYLSARNLSITQKKDLDLFVPCPMCHLSLSECQRVIKNNRDNVVNTDVSVYINKDNINLIKNIISGIPEGVQLYTRFRLLGIKLTIPTKITIDKENFG